MPKQMQKESRGDYVSRTVQKIRAEDPSMPMDAVLGKAYGMWNTDGPEAKRKGKAKK